MSYSRGPKGLGGWGAYHRMGRRAPHVAGIDPNGHRIEVAVQSHLRRDRVLAEMRRLGYTEIEVDGRPGWDPIELSAAIELLASHRYEIEPHSLSMWTMRLPDGKGYLVPAHGILQERLRLIDPARAEI